MMNAPVPPHPGLGLQREIDALGLSVAEVAGALGVTRHQLFDVLNARAGITPDLAVRLELAFGGTAESWVQQQAAHDLAKVRRNASRLIVMRLAKA